VNHDSEISRIQKVYEEYAQSPARAEKYSFDNLGNWANLQQRLRVTGKMLAEHNFVP